MTTKLDIINALSRPEEKRFEAQMTERYGRKQTIRSTPLKEFVDVSTGLLEDKIATLVLEGAYDEAGYWRELANLHVMQSEKEEVPITTMRNFVVRRGTFSEASKEESGGKVNKVTLDVSNEDRERYIYFQIRQRDIELKRFAFIEDSIRQAGRAFAAGIRDDILKAYVADVGQTQALGGDTRFTAIMKLISKMNKVGFGVDTLIVDSDDFVEAITEQAGTAGPLPWLTAMAFGPSVGGNFAPAVGNLNGLVGQFAGRIPIYVVGNTTASLNGKIMGVERGKGEVFGLHKDISIVNDIKVIQDLYENKMMARYDIAKANANAIGHVTGA